MSNIKIPIEKDFYEKVEQKNYLKHIIYGDSVVGESLVEYKYKGIQTNSSIESLWDRLISSGLQIEEIDGKEYLFLPENSEILKIQTPDLKNDQIIWVTPKYLMRHAYRGEIYNNYLTNDLMISTTLNHSFVDINMKNLTYKEKNPIEVQVVPILATCSLRVPLKFSLVYGHETKYDYLGVVRNSRANKQLLSCLRPWKLCKKNRTPDFEGYVYDFEVPETHVFFANNVLVHNTDSLFNQ